MRVEFITPLDLRFIGMRKGRSWWRLAHDFGYAIDGVAAVIPTGFETDFASVPRLPVAYLLAGDVSHSASLIHDWLYSNKSNRKWADRVFMAALKAEGVSRWRRALMYWAVRLFGWRSHE